MIVPAPTIILGWKRTRWEIKSIAPATVMVISTIGTPPRETASAAKCASSADDTLIAGTMPISLIRAQTSVFFMTEFLPAAAGDSIPAGPTAAAQLEIRHTSFGPGWSYFIKRRGA